jgi:hypothetical protein
MSAGQSASVSNAYTGGYGYGNRGATYNPSTGVSASGGRATVGNAYTGQQTTVGHVSVTGPGGQSTQVTQRGDEYYGDHDGNAYSYNSATGQAQKYNSTGTWSNVDKPPPRRRPPGKTPRPPARKGTRSPRAQPGVVAGEEAAAREAAVGPATVEAGAAVRAAAGTVGAETEAGAAGGVGAAAAGAAHGGGGFRR